MLISWTCSRSIGEYESCAQRIKETNFWIPCSPAGQPVGSLGPDSVSHRCSDGYSDRRTGSQEAVLQRSHVEALHRSVSPSVFFFNFPLTPCQSKCFCLCPTEDMSWVAAETLAEGPTPEARIGHTAVYDPESRRIFVFGGSKNKKWFNDVHILDTQTWKWTMVEVRARVALAGFKSVRAPPSHPLPPLLSPPGSREDSPSGLPQLQHVSGRAVRAGRSVSTSKPRA